MRKYYKRILFSKTPLKTQFRYKDKFQIFPIESETAPSNPYCKHFPLFLEYYIEFDKNQSPENVDIFDDLSAQQVVEFEIMNLLSVLSNHRFFKYRLTNNQWGINTPNIAIENLKPNEKNFFNNQTSSWIISGYFYPGLKADLEINNFSKLDFPQTQLVTPYYQYFTIDPVEKEKGEILFPETIISSLDNYYSLSSKTLKKIKFSIALICDGLDISDFKRSLAFLSFVSAIEALAGLEISNSEIEFDCNSCHSIKKSPHYCPDCNKPIWGIKAKFKAFLKTFVAGGVESVSKYNRIYNLRSKIAHQGQLFISDYEFSFDNIDKKGDDWLMKLETLQLARISLTNWLRYEKKASC